MRENNLFNIPSDKKLCCIIGNKSYKRPYQYSNPPIEYSEILAYKKEYVADKRRYQVYIQ